MLAAAGEGPPLRVHAVPVGQQFTLDFLEDHGLFGDAQVLHYPVGVLDLPYILQSKEDAVGAFHHRPGGGVNVVPHHRGVEGVKPVQQNFERVVALHRDYPVGLAPAPVERTERALRGFGFGGVHHVDVDRALVGVVEIVASEPALVLLCDPSRTLVRVFHPAILVEQVPDHVLLDVVYVDGLVVAPILAHNRGCG